MIIVDALVHQLGQTLDILIYISFPQGLYQQLLTLHLLLFSFATNARTKYAST